MGHHHQNRCWILRCTPWDLEGNGAMSCINRDIRLAYSKTARPISLTTWDERSRRRYDRPSTVRLKPTAASNLITRCILPCNQTHSTMPFSRRRSPWLNLKRVQIALTCTYKPWHPDSIQMKPLKQMTHSRWRPRLFVPLHLVVEMVNATNPAV